MPSASDVCSPAESSSIHTALHGVALDFSDRRNLRERRLNGSDCYNLCANFPPGMCDSVYPHCPNRRHLSKTDEEAAPAQFERETLARTSCAVEIAAVNAKLDRMENTVSPGCKNVLQAPRSLTCYTTAPVITTWPTNNHLW